jgi:hypothetical protein
VAHTLHLLRLMMSVLYWRQCKIAFRGILEPVSPWRPYLRAMLSSGPVMSMNSARESLLETRLQGLETSSSIGRAAVMPATASGYSMHRPNYLGSNLAKGCSWRLSCNDALPVPLAGLEPAACCLGGNCQSSAESVPVGSRQVGLGRDCAQCGPVVGSRAWWNDRQNDQQRKPRCSGGDVVGVVQHRGE